MQLGKNDIYSLNSKLKEGLLTMSREYYRSKKSVKTVFQVSDAMQCDAMRCNAMPCHAMPCNAMERNAMPCHAMQCDGALENTVNDYLFSYSPPSSSSSPNLMIEITLVSVPPSSLHLHCIRSF